MITFHRNRAISGLVASLAWLVCVPALAAVPYQDGSGSRESAGATSIATLTPTYADLVDLIEPAPLVLTVQIRQVAQVEPERANGVRPGWARIYVQARGATTLRGSMPPADTLSYLADVRLDGRGKLPPLAKHTVLLVARPVAGHPEMVQLVAPDAQLPWDAALEARVRAILVALQAADAPVAIKSVREASFVPGALVGEGETQIFLATTDGSPAAISVRHQAGKSSTGTTTWSVSFSEVVDASGEPPAHDTLAWYRLACFLPAELPPSSNVSDTPENRAQAAADYHLVMAGLGPCQRART